MLRFMMLLAVAAAAYGIAKHYGIVGSREAPIAMQADGQTIVARIDDGKATFSINGPAAETYMVFGGAVGGSSFAHGSFNGIELAAIRRISKRYPDFHRCDSAGAPEAKRAAEDINVVASAPVVSQLGRAISDANTRERGKGERLCATVRGSWLTLEEVRKGETAITGEQYAKMIPANATKQYFLHVETFEAADCKDAI